MTGPTPHLAFLFPGQGSQSVGMLGEIGVQRPVVRDTFAEAGAALGFDLWALVSDGPEAELNRTEHTQPAMLAAGVAMWRVWRAVGGPLPGWMAGHSLGEYTALVCAGSLAFGAAVPLVAERGRLMQQAVPDGVGAMAAILGLSDDDVRSVCAEAAGKLVVEAANLNAPGQVVIAGHAEAVERASTLARERGARRVMTLPVSVPSHCVLMRPAAEQLRARLAEVEIRAPEVPVLHNTDVAPRETPESIREALVRQLHSPVRWVETVEALAARGVTTTVECGPGKVLAGLVRRIDKRLAAMPLFDESSLETALTAARGEG